MVAMQSHAIVLFSSKGAVLSSASASVKLKAKAKDYYLRLLAKHVSLAGGCLTMAKKGIFVWYCNPWLRIYVYEAQVIMRLS